MTTSTSAAAQIAVQQITLDGLSFAYSASRERPAVDAVSFKVGAGELVAIVGPNGCGKSTLLRLIIGELKPTAGQVLIDGITPFKLGPVAAARRLGMVPQQGSSAAFGAGFGYLVREIVLMGRFAAHAESGLLGGAMGFETAADLDLANAAMWKMDVHQLAERPIDTLSGGERQRVAIARCLAQDTPILLLDEPTSALDLAHQLDLLEHLRSLVQASRRAVLWVTHDLNLALQHAGRVIVMDRGRIVADGPPAATLTAAVLEPVYGVRVNTAATSLLSFSKAVDLTR